MIINCLASSSYGNCYLITNNKTTLMIEAGLRFKEIKNKLLDHGVVLTRISAVAVTHSHGDHAMAAQEMSMYAPIIASTETLDAAQVRRNRLSLTPWDWITIRKDSMRIQAFEVDHDCPGAYGFIVEDLENDERMLFINDTKLVRWDFSKHSFDYIMIECNHNDEILDLKESRTKRTAEAHMSLRTTKITLSKMNLTNTKAIYLMHLSGGNSDEERMINEVKALTGKPTYACQKNGGVR